MAVIGINYSGGNEYDDNDKIIKCDIVYESVYCHSLGDKQVLFNSGDFVKDWFECTKYAITEISENEHISNSSTVDHFIMDGAKFDSAYMLMENGPVELCYTYDHNHPRIELFVEEGTKPSWLELKEYCKK
jgi:hypothetical protein